MPMQSSEKRVYGGAVGYNTDFYTASLDFNS